MKPKRIAVAVSGSGRTLENLIATRNSFEVAAVIVSNKTCRGHTIAQKAGLPIFFDTFADIEKTKHQIFPWLESHKIDFVALGGFLKKFPVISPWENRIFNIHPSLLPKFGGKNMYGSKVHSAVIKAQEKESGATVHVVNEVYDDGPLISQASVNIEENDTPESLAAKVFKIECILYPKTLDLIAKNGGFQVDQKITRYDNIANEPLD